MSGIAYTPVVGAAKDGGTAPRRRDFLYLTTAAVGAAGFVASAWPFIDSVNPAADARAQAMVEVNIGSVKPGQMITVSWQGKPVFIRRRTPDEIKAARAVVVTALRDPEDDAQRVQRPEWLIVVGACTHLGCVPLFDGAGSSHLGRYGGWFCSCHGSQFDTSGRIRQGPAPKNLIVPRYVFLTDDVVRIG